MGQTACRKISTDERGIVISWLLKIVVFLSLAAVILFDAGSIVVNKVTLDSSADETAIAVSVTIGSTPPEFFTEQEIFLLARDVVKDPANGVLGARVSRRGTFIDDEGTVHIRLRRKADTVAAHFLPFLRRSIAAYGDGTAGTN